MYFDFQGNKHRRDKKKKVILNNIYTRPGHKVSDKITTQNIKTKYKFIAKLSKKKGGKAEAIKRIPTILNELFNLTKEKNTRNQPMTVINGNNAQTILEKFEVNKGVTLKTRNFVLKNRNRDDEFIDDDGKRRVTKNFFEKKLKKIKEGVKYKSRSSILKYQKRSRSKKLKKIKQSQDRYHKETNRRIMERIQSMTTSQDDSGVGISKKKESIKIFDKNYQKFLKKISKEVPMNLRKKSSYIDSDASLVTKKEFMSKEMSEKLNMLNLRMRQRETQMQIYNKPVQKNFTYKNLKSNLKGNHNRSFSFVRERKKEGGLRPRERKVKNRSFQLQDELSVVNKTIIGDEFT